MWLAQAARIAPDWLSGKGIEQKNPLSVKEWRMASNWLGRCDTVCLRDRSEERDWGSSPTLARWFLGRIDI
jgi:hypothetical protein